jgi:hypothetical protein
MFDVFNSFHEFRNYVLGVHDEEMPFARNHLQTIVNENNPVISQSSMTLALQSNRQRPWDGTVGLSSKDELFDKVELAWNFDNDDDEDSDDVDNGDDGDDTISLYRQVSAEVTIPKEKAGISELALSLKLSGYEKEIPRAVMITDGSEVLCEKKEDVLTVINGKISFSASPKFVDTLYTLVYEGREWIHSGYPELKPYSWYNPFIGGIKTSISKLGNRLTLREEITAEFTTETDVLGNIWTGIRMDVSVSKHDKYKGISYSQYYLTLPGVPVLCHFMRLNNGTGRYLKVNLFPQVFITDKAANENTVVTMSAEDGQEYRLRFDGEEDEMSYDRLLCVERDGDMARTEKLYIFKDSKRDGSTSSVQYDLDLGVTDHNVDEKEFEIPDGEVFTTKPLLCLITEKKLTPEVVEDFGRIEF